MDSWPAFIKRYEDIVCSLWGTLHRNSPRSVKLAMGTERRFRNSIGPQLRRLRNERNLTQSALAGKLQRTGLDMDRTTLAKIEMQIRSVFDFEVAMIARSLSVPTDALFPSIHSLQRALPRLLKGSIETVSRRRRATHRPGGQGVERGSRVRE
jgi:transcriptional regulator with XRE-family HTH domain